MRVLLTGGSGFLGSHVADRLAARRDVELKLMLRRSSNVTHIRGLPYERVDAELGDLDSLVEAVKGVEVVVHVAGATSAVSEAEFQAINNLGTAMIGEAARREGVERFVYISSIAARGPSDGASPPDVPPRPVSAYGRSKLAGEYALMSLKDSMRVAVVRPPVVYGQRDRALLPFYRIAKLGFFPIYGDGLQRLSWVHVLDAAEAISMLAVSDFRTGAIYTLSDGDVHTWVSLVRAFGEAWGRQPRVLKAPPVLFALAAHAGGFAQQLVRRPLPLTPDKLREMQPRAWLCDHEAITRDLGWKPAIDINEGFRQSVAWYRDQGWL